ncbi:MAG: nucleoside phosphorylase [Bacilli bacterium]|jgi:purine-nucleoside phosphorylase|nr:nucleoside phosphorylase [Bacilli bacterium]
MIIDSYRKEDGKMSPQSVYGPGKNIADVCIVTFSEKLTRMILEEYHPEMVADMGSTNGHTPIYVLTYQGKKICFYNSPMGSALAGTYSMVTAHLVGVKKFIVFGSAGRLDKAITPLSFIVPTAAYRDEGLSYHYVPAGDYIEIKNHRFIEAFLKDSNIPYFSGKCWTTDAFYKETESEIQQRKQEGCIAVDMECAGMQAVADYYGFDFYEFFFGVDQLDSLEWDKATMGSGKDVFRHHDIFELALAMALKI